MNSYDIVSKTLEHDCPPRVARSFGDCDLLLVEPACKGHATDWEKLDDRKWQRTDEWGNIWARVDPTSKGEVVKGSIENIKNAENYEFPDLSNPADYNNIKQAKSQNPDKYVMGILPGFAFNIARKLLKFDQYFMDLATEPALMHRLHDRVDQVVTDMLTNCASADADCIMFNEDWGTQLQLLINPKMWAEEFYPRFKKLCSLGHQLGLKIFMHSCGQITEIMPQLIEAGVDAFQFDQPELHGLDTLASYQKDAKVTFWCPVDIQKTLQTRNEDIIRAKAREMLDKLWLPKGGFIAGYHEDNLSIGLDPKWQECASDEFTRHGTR